MRLHLSGQGPGWQKPAGFVPVERQSRGARIIYFGATHSVFSMVLWSQYPCMIFFYHVLPGLGLLIETGGIFIVARRPANVLHLSPPKHVFILHFFTQHVCTLLITNWLGLGPLNCPEGLGGRACVFMVRVYLCGSPTCLNMSRQNQVPDHLVLTGWSMSTLVLCLVPQGIR